MTNEEVERAIEFLVQHHAKVSADIERNSEQINRLTERIERNSEQIERNSEQIGRHSGQIGQLTETVAATQSQIDSLVVEMREGFNNLIVANEVTRKLAEDVARLAIQTSQRVTNLEQQ
jgi:ABC-type transporter Mla subunit MlaD